LDLSRDERELKKHDVPRQESVKEDFRTNHPSSMSSAGHQNQMMKDHSQQNNSVSKSPGSQQSSLASAISQPQIFSPPQSSFGQQQLKSQSPLQQYSKNENGSAYSPMNRVNSVITNSSETANQFGDKAVPKNTTPALNGVVRDKAQEGNELAKENERTKMSFLLN
jgi:hypothetical protein